MGKFKVGDRVRAVNGTCILKVGSDHVVARMTDKKTFVDIHPYGTLDYTHDYFEPVAVAASNGNLRIEAGKYYKTRDGRKVGPARLYDNGQYSQYYKLCKWVVDGVLYQDNGTFSDGDAPKHDLIAEWSDEPTYTSNPAAEVDNLRDECGPVGAAANDNGTGSTAGFTVPVFGDDDAPIRYENGKFIVNAARFVPPVAPATSGKEDADNDNEPDAKLRVSISADTSALDAEIDRVLKRLRKLKRKARKLGISLEYSELRDAA